MYLCPATKLWNTGQGANAMREAVSLMGGYGITEDCPGFFGPQMDGCPTGSYLRGAGSGPAPADKHDNDQRGVPETIPRTGFGRCASSPAAETRHPAPVRWLPPWRYGCGHWSIFKKVRDANGTKLFVGARQGVTCSRWPTLCAGCWLRRQQISGFA